MSPKMAAAYSSDVISDECNHSESRHGEARFLAQVDGACITGGGTFAASAFNWIEIRKVSGLAVMRENGIDESLGYRLDCLYS